MDATRKLPIEELAEEDDSPGLLAELIRMLQSGDANQAAVRVRLPDGTETEFTLGSDTPEERELLLATLQSQLETKH